MTTKNKANFRFAATLVIFFCLPLQWLGGTSQVYACSQKEQQAPLQANDIYKPGTVAYPLHFLLK